MAVNPDLVAKARAEQVARLRRLAKECEQMTPGVVVTIDVPEGLSVHLNQAANEIEELGKIVGPREKKPRIVQGTFELGSDMTPEGFLSFRGVGERIYLVAHRDDGIRCYEGLEYKVVAQRDDDHDLVLVSCEHVPMDDDRRKLRQNEAMARERVIKAALECASDQFDQQAEDPGWQADSNDDRLRDMAIEYTTAIHARRSINA